MLSLSCDLCDDDEDLKEGISVKWFRFRTDFLSFRLYLRLLLLLFFGWQQGEERQLRLGLLIED